MIEIEHGDQAASFVVSYYSKQNIFLERACALALALYYLALHSSPMDSAPNYDVPTLHERLDFLRKASETVISTLVDSIPELRTCLPQDYIRGLGPSDRTICLRSSLVCWAVTQGRIVPREMQFRSILADQRGRDSLISAGTGSGKTLPIALCTLLDDPAKKNVTIVVSPLKRLQKSQANEFMTRFGIRAVAINEDTPRDSIWWSVSHMSICFTHAYTHIFLFFHTG